MPDLRDAMGLLIKSPIASLKSGFYCIWNKPLSMWRFATFASYEYYAKLSREYIRLKEYTTNAIEKYKFNHRYCSDRESPNLLTSFFT